MITITVERVRHDGGMRVTLRFPTDRELTERVKMLPGAVWSERLNCWHIPYAHDVVSMLLETFSRDAYVDYTAFRKTNPVISFSEDGKTLFWASEKYMLMAAMERNNIPWGGVHAFTEHMLYTFKIPDKTANLCAPFEKPHLKRLEAYVPPRHSRRCDPTWSAYSSHAPVAVVY